MRSECLNERMNTGYHKVGFADALSVVNQKILTDRSLIVLASS